MSEFQSLSYDELHQKRQELLAIYDALCAQGLVIDITRGKPAPDQLDLANSLLTLPGQNYLSARGEDCRNYGNPRGLSELIDIFAPLLPAPPSQTVALGNSSLEIMHTLCIASFFSTPPGGDKPWKQDSKFLCPVPGYDRHFLISQSLGMEMIPIAMREDGPDLDEIESLVAADPLIKGLWMVPIYSNPSGVTISEEKMERLAAMPTAAPDFRIFWDNAYAVHSLYGKPPVRDILSACERHGNPDRVYIFASTSKITFAGAGVAFLASSLKNVNWYMSYRSMGSIGPDKLNQLRHAQYFQSTEHVHEIMAEHAKLIRPKFACALEILEDKLGGTKVAAWSKPEGGYFINIDVLEGTAKRVIELANKAGVKFTPAGSTFPLDYDPKDENIRLAPTFVDLDELEVGMNVLTCCILLAAVEQLLSKSAESLMV